MNSVAQRGHAFWILVLQVFVGEFVWQVVFVY